MEKQILRKVVSAEVKITFSLEETLAVANALNAYYNITRGGVSPNMEALMHEFNELSKDLNPL